MQIGGEQEAGTGHLRSLGVLQEAERVPGLLPQAFDRADTIGAGVHFRSGTHGYVGTR